MLAYVDYFEIQRFAASLLDVHIRGWVGADPYEILVVADGTEVAKLKNNLNRPDVCAVMKEEVHDNLYGFEHHFLMHRFVEKVEIYALVENARHHIKTIPLLLKKSQPKNLPFSYTFKQYLHTKFTKPQSFTVDNTLRETYCKRYGYVSNRLYQPNNPKEYQEWLSFQSYRVFDTTFKDITFLLLNNNTSILPKFSSTKQDSLDVAMVSTQYVCIIDQDAIIHPQFYGYLSRIQEFDALYTDHDYIDEKKERHDPVLAPSASYETLLGYNYVGGILLARKDVLQNIHANTVYEIALELMRQNKNIKHIHKVLYSLKQEKDTLEPLLNHLNNHQEEYVFIPEEERRYHPLSFIPTATPKVTIVIPTKDHVEDLDRCLKSLEKSTYSNFDILIINNNSSNETKKYLDSLKNVKVVDMMVPFNYAKINNDAIKYHTDSEYIIYLNNDTEVISENWIESMLGFCMKEGVGTVGMKLLYGDNTLQHHGILMGRNDHKNMDNGKEREGVAGNYFEKNRESLNNYRDHVASNVMASTAACLMVKREAFEKVGGMEEKLAVAFNDVDFCLKIHEAGYRNVYLPFVKMYHLESQSRGKEDTPEKIARFTQEVMYMQEHHAKEIHHDIYYNPNYSIYQLFWLKDVKDTTYDIDLDID